MRNEHESALEEALEDVPAEELEQVAHTGFGENAGAQLDALVGLHDARVGDGGGHPVGAAHGDGGAALHGEAVGLALHKRAACGLGWRRGGDRLRI